MSLFRKPKKHIQRRVFSSQEDDEVSEQKMEVDDSEDKTNVQTNNSKVKRNGKKERSQIQNKQTLLSFGDEDEGEVFQVRKSSHSKKIMKLLDKERRKKKEEKSEGEQVKSKTEDKRTEIVTGDLVMVVKNWENPRILNGRAAVCAGKEDVSDSEEEEGPPEGLQGSHRFSHPDTVRIVLQQGKIPDAAMIHAARKRRQRARELGSDWVPLQTGAEESQTPPVPDKGRLVREDDDSDEERIDMSVNHAARDRDARREQFFAAQDNVAESEHDTDREMEEWENQQIRKGVTGAQLAAASQEACYSIQQQVTVQPEIQHEPGMVRTPAAIADKLKERLTKARQSYQQHETELKNICEERNTLKRELEQHEDKAPTAAQRFRFYQELRGYVTDLVECLDEKVGEIATLEQRSLDIMSREAERLMERRRQDVRDQAEEIAAQGRPRVTNSAAAVKSEAEEEARIRRAAEREGRRARRRRAREQAGTVRHQDGMSSDDEIPAQEQLAAKQAYDQLSMEVYDLFSDVVDDYSSIGSILARWERWKETDPNAYSEAYAGMCAPKVVSPLVRMALVLWNPLCPGGSECAAELEKQAWYNTLMLYSAKPGQDNEDVLLSDPDSTLVPAVVERVVVPRLTRLVERCWDPMSSSQTLRLVGMIGRFVRRYPSLGPDSRALSLLFNAVLDKLRQALEHDVFIPIFSKQSQESKSPFFQRQFASALKLLRNVTSWQGLVNDRLLKELALNSLLNRYLLSSMRVCQLTDAVSKAGLVSHSLPRVWMSRAEFQDGGLAPFAAYVTQLAQQLDKENPLHLESIETVAGILRSLRAA